MFYDKFQLTLMDNTFKDDRGNFSGDKGGA